MCSRSSSFHDGSHQECGGSSGPPVPRPFKVVINGKRFSEVQGDQRRGRGLDLVYWRASVRRRASGSKGGNSHFLKRTSVFQAKLRPEPTQNGLFRLLDPIPMNHNDIVSYYVMCITQPLYSIIHFLSGAKNPVTRANL